VLINVIRPCLLIKKSALCIHSGTRRDDKRKVTPKYWNEIECEVPLNSPKSGLALNLMQVPWPEFYKILCFVLRRIFAWKERALLKLVRNERNIEVFM
jgi:hypothetical protein